MKMTKRILALALTLVMALSLAACGGKSNANANANANVNANGGYGDGVVDTLPSAVAPNLTPFWLLGLALVLFGSAVLVNEKRRMAQS